MTDSTSSLSSASFLKRYRLLVLLAWLVPPVFGLSFLLFIQLFTAEQMVAILTNPLEPAFITLSLVAAYLYLNWYIQPVARFIADPGSGDPVAIDHRLHHFARQFWSVFIVYLLLAPASVIVSAELYTDFVARPVDWFRIHLVALIVSIIVGLPIFFMLLDLFGRITGQLALTRPHLTVKTKVFLIGALVPLLIDTTLVQYYWTRTGIFDLETFLMWLVLELLAVAGSLLFVRSFRQSLQPLASIIETGRTAAILDVSRLQPQSTDELGVLTARIRRFAEELQFQGELLEIRNQILSSVRRDELLAEAFTTILDISDTAFASDMSFILVLDRSSDELVNVMYSGSEYNPSGYHRLSLTTSSLAVLAFKSTSVICIRDARNDPRLNQKVVTDTGIRSSIAAPLLVGDEPVGVLISGTTRVIRDYTARDKRVINALAQEAALIVNTLLLHEDYRQSEQRYRQLNELAPDPVLLLDADGKIIEANRAAKRLFGMDLPELQGVAMESFVAGGEDRGKCRQALLIDGSETPKICEFALAQERNGMPVAVQVHAMALKLGNVHVIQAILRDVTAQKQAEERIRRSEEELSAIFNSMQDIYYRTDLEGRVVRITPSVEKLFGYAPEEITGKPIALLYANPEERGLFLRTLEEAGGVVKGYEAQMRRKDGTTFWVSTNAQYYRGADGQIAGVEGSGRDTTKIRSAKEELYQEKERAQVTLESIGDGVITTDVNGRIEYLNPVAEQLCGWSAGEAIGARFEEIFRLVDDTSRYAIDSPIESCLHKHLPLSSDRDIMLIDKHGREFAVEYSVAPLRDRDHQTVGTVVGLHDVTEMRQMAQQLTHQATHDALTGLINRREFEVRLRNALDLAHTGDEQHALCYLDLDQFKIVNDTCGHVAGDELLKQIGARLREKVRRADTLARLGGDEFGVLLWDCPLETARKITEELRQAVQENRFSWQGHIFDVGASIGLVPINAESGTLTEVLSAADSACYAAKDRGRNRVHVYQPDDQVLAQRHGEMQWVSRINHSMEQGRLRLYGQRIIAVAGDNPSLRWEVLVRMVSEDGGIVPPMAFIPAAERYHLMPRIDEWVIQEALKILARYRSSDIMFNINVSGQSLSDDGFLDQTLAVLDETTVDARQICFEITETAAIANLTQANRFIAALRTKGCQFALDDFGSGLSSFGYLKNLRVDFLKIDGSFVRDIVDDPIDYAMVESINNVGHTLGLMTIAEFVEKDSVFQKVRELGVDYVQGYLMSVPVPLEEDVAAEVGMEAGYVRQ